MIPGFEKIVEQRIDAARRKGAFNNLKGAGKPLMLEDDSHIPEDLRLAYKILKNADCLPPEIELKKQIARTEDLLADMQDTRQRYRVMKKLNYLIMKYNTLRQGDSRFDIPQRYMGPLTERLTPENR